MLEPLADELAAISRRQPPSTAIGPWTDAYAGLNVPVTLLLGENNEGEPPNGTAFAAFARVMPQALTVCIAGQGHLADACAPRSLPNHVVDAIKAS